MKGCFLFISKTDKSVHAGLCSADHSCCLGGQSLSLLGLELGSDSVQVTAALAGQSASTVRILLCQLQAFQSLQSLPSNTSIAASPVGWGGAVVRTDSVDLADGGDSNWGPDVHVSGHGGASDKEPVLIIRSLKATQR